MTFEQKIATLEGPLLVIGASGFVGANLLRALLARRADVTGTFFSGSLWRLEGVPSPNLLFLNLQDRRGVAEALARLKPKTIFDCSAFGAYSFEEDFVRIHETNYLALIHLLEELKKQNISAFVHAGSSSEYGLNASAPAEDAPLLPNSHYAVSKAAASHALSFYGKVVGVPVVNLRLYSLYGPFEDSSRLIPALCSKALEGRLPPFAQRGVCRDFVHIDDAVEAFVDAALRIGPAVVGESFNIGSGTATSLEALASLSKELFSISETPTFSRSEGRAWDVDDWRADIEKSAKLLDWRPKIALRDGLQQTCAWWREFLPKRDVAKLSKRGVAANRRSSVSAVVACYKDEQAIPIMYQRLSNVFNRIGMDYEIIFVNDNSPDDSAETIRAISASDPRVVGISHSRNFGSQAAFRSGMEISSKESCVLLDGDLQDPPELIESFVKEWRAGHDVVFGRRVKREMPFWLDACYQGFYRLFSLLSDFPIPKDAGDFSLMDREVVYWLLQCRERDSFLRGLRAYVGFKQTGVDYVRPERMFGVSTNNWIRNIGWAKKGIFSVSRVPLHALTLVGGVASAGTMVLAMVSVLIRFVSPESAPRGITFLALLVMFFGSLTMLGIGLLGEYIGKIFEEAKARPPFIRREMIVRGEIKPVHYAGGGSR